MLYHRKKSWRLCAGRIPLFLLCCVLLFATGCTSSDTGSGSNKEATVARGIRYTVCTGHPGCNVTGTDRTGFRGRHLWKRSGGTGCLPHFRWLCDASLQRQQRKVKVQVTLPEGTEYTYPVTASEDYFVYPLPGGNGTYQDHTVGIRIGGR